MTDSHEQEARALELLEEVGAHLVLVVTREPSGSHSISGALQAGAQTFSLAVKAGLSPKKAGARLAKLINARVAAALVTKQ